jgi:2-methylcitrate dehydratase PrpD
MMTIKQLSRLLSPIMAIASAMDSSRSSFVVEQLAVYIIEFRKRNVAPRLRNAALRCIFDLLTAVMVALEDTGAKATRQVALSTMAPGHIPIWFTEDKSNLIGAAWANSAAAAALDLDDGNRRAMGHPGAAIIPAAWSAAIELNRDFDDLVAAIVIGYEIAVTIGAARKEFGETMTWSVYGVVAACAALRDLNQTATENALGIAGQYISSRTAFLTPSLAGSHVKEGIPWSVFCGMQAVLLAGPINHLEDEVLYRFPKSLSLGQNEFILDTYFKLYACCRYIHAPIDALLDLSSRYDISHSSIKHIVVHTFRRAADELSNRIDPRNFTEVQYSIPYCLFRSRTPSFGNTQS